MRRQLIGCSPWQARRVRINMDSFNFRLQPVLEHRRRLENQAKQELARAKVAEHQAREVLTSMEVAFGDGQSDMADARRAEIDTSEVAVYQRYLDRLKQDIAEQDGIVTTLHIHSEQRRSEVIDGMKARKVVEKLKERQYQEYRIEVNRYEQKQVDEFATTRYNRSKGQIGVEQE
jgi:flagellar FliJ protein